MMSYFTYTDLISSLPDPNLVNPGSTLVDVGAYGHMYMKAKHRAVCINVDQR